MTEHDLADSDTVQDEWDSLLQHAPKPSDSNIRWRPVILIVLMLLFTGIAFFMSIAPQTRLFEDIICRQVYDDRESIPYANHTGSPSEDMCKIPQVQGKVAMLFGMQTFFDGIPGLLLAIPYGVYADKFGRREVLILSMSGQLAGALWVLLVCKF
jgi:MFS family permease